jgi:hypothetical protein
VTFGGNVDISILINSFDIVQKLADNVASRVVSCKVETNAINEEVLHIFNDSTNSLATTTTLPVFVRPNPTPNSFELFHTIWENWPALNDPFGSEFQVYCFTSSYQDLSAMRISLKEESRKIFN